MLNPIRQLVRLRPLLRGPAVTVVAVSLFGCCCCTAPPRDAGAPVADGNPMPADAPTVAQLVAAHNERASSIERLWARSVIEIEFTDEDGKERFEQGEGHLVLEKPHNSAMTIGKVGQTKLWAGSNSEHYWLFDTLNQSTLYLGPPPADAEKVYRSPLPVQPRDLPLLLGIGTIDVDAASPELVSAAAPTSAAVNAETANDALTLAWRDNRYVLDLSPAGKPLRYHFSPISLLPTRIELLDRAGTPVITAELSRPRRMHFEKRPVGAYINTRIEVTFTDRDAAMTLFLADATNAPSKINAKLFDLEVLRKLNKPEAVKYIVP